MKLSGFFTKYSDEQSCKMFFKQQRETEGIVCKQCGSVCYYWIEQENRWRCKDCKRLMGLNPVQLWKIII
jgi:acetyl-CoA carboxylase beta subunit